MQTASSVTCSAPARIIWRAASTLASYLFHGGASERSTPRQPSFRGGQPSRGRRHRAAIARHEPAVRRTGRSFLTGRAGALALLARHYRLEMRPDNAENRPRARYRGVFSTSGAVCGRSPGGAAVRHRLKDLLRIAKNVSVNDPRAHRRSITGPRCAAALRHRARRRHPPSGLNAEPRPRTAHRPRLYRRTGWERTTGRSQAPSRAIAPIFDCFERIGTRPRPCGIARARDWDDVGRQIAVSGRTQRLRCHDNGVDELMEARAAGAAAKVCGAGGGGCLFCYGPPKARQAIARALADGAARVLEYRIEMEGLRLG